MNKQYKRVAMLLGAGGLATMIVPSGTRAESAAAHRVDLSVVCLTATSIRIAASNDSPRTVDVSANEIGLDASASDELRAVFPIEILAQSDRVVTWDLPVPAHVGGVARAGSERWFHGLWKSPKWNDENGLSYRATGRVDLHGAGATGGAVDIAECRLPASMTSPATSPVTSLAPPTSPPDTSVETPTIVASIAVSEAEAEGEGEGGDGSVAPAPDPITPSSVATSTPRVDEAIALIEVRPVAWRSTSNSQLAPFAFDRSPDTAFVTQMQDGSPATLAWLSADLGRAVDLSRIEWMWSAQGAADDATIRVSLDGVAWTVLDEMVAAATGTWVGTDVVTTARYVRYSFRNPNRDPQIGHLAEVRVLAEPTARGLDVEPQSSAGYGPPGRDTGDPTALPASSSEIPAGTRAKIEASNRSSNSAISSSRLPIDGSAATSWITTMSVAPWTGWVSFDLGAVAPLRTIQWMIAQPELADSYRIQVSSDRVHWDTIAVQTNPPEANEWLTLPVQVDTRHVRFYFRNPNLDANIGTLGEVQFFVA